MLAVRPQHLYIHIPFCHRRCAYCDFNTYANMEDRITAYVAALCSELHMLREVVAQHPGTPTTPLVPTIFFGGGTPSMLTLPQLEQILAAAHPLLPPGAVEVTLEANPGSVLGDNTDALSYLRGLRALGVNRLSLGVQTLDDATLRVLGRTHTAAEAYATYMLARRAGFERINLDFIFGLPGQTVAQWAHTLAALQPWQPDHLALYSLIVEPDTPLHAQVLGGRVSVPDDDTTGAMYELAMEHLAAAGYTQYEVSNWARPTVSGGVPSDGYPAQASQHNLAYWLNSDYLAAGAGAHGHVFPTRYSNLRGINQYIAAVQRGTRPLAEQVDLTRDDLHAETMFMGLRLNDGVRADHFAARTGADLYAVYGDTLQPLIADGLLARDAQGVRLTARGRLLGNRVFAAFV